MQEAIISATVPQPEPATIAAPRALWRVLDALAPCRQHYGLAAHSLSVLRALISFLPKATTVDAALVVWPSNKTLCERADGMDERTLRRHIDRLVKAGIIARRSSSNGKRFALRCRSDIVAAFGFDLRPLLDSAENIAATTERLRAQAEQAAALRVEVLNLLHAVAQSSPPLPGCEDAAIRRMLRRRPDPRMLLEARDKLRTMVSNHSPVAEKMTASDRQIDRHLQKTEEESFDSVSAPHDAAAPVTDRETATKQDDRRDETGICFDDCLRATTESQEFAAGPVRTWSDMIHLADTLAPMIGIERELSDHTRRAMGPVQAAISILCLIQRSHHIRRPAAYLRKLATLAESGKYSLKSLVRAASAPRFAAANHEFA